MPVTHDDQEPPPQRPSSSSVERDYQPEATGAAHQARATSRRWNRRWIVTSLVIALLAGLGWSWGWQGIAKPEVSLGYLLRDVVRVWTSEPDSGLVNVTWTTQPSGTVRMTVQLHRRDARPVTVLVALECDTRFEEFSVVSSNHASVEPRNGGGTEAGCEEGSSQEDFLTRPVQLMLVRFDGPADSFDSIAWEGQPVATWTDEAAGERIGYAPYVWLGGPFPGTTPIGELVDSSLEPEVPDVAVIETIQAGSPSETVSSYFPGDTPLAIFGTNLGATGEIQNQMTPRGPRIDWKVSWSAEPQQGRQVRHPYYAHTTTVARWSDSSKSSLAQLQLLLSGLLLGLAGAVVIEALLIWARSPSESPRGPD